MSRVDRGTKHKAGKQVKRTRTGQKYTNNESTAIFFPLQNTARRQIAASANYTKKGDNALICKGNYRLYRLRAKCCLC